MMLLHAQAAKAATVMLQPGPATLAVAAHLLHARLPNSLGTAFPNCLLSTVHDEYLHLLQELSC